MINAGRMDQLITLQVKATPATYNDSGEDVSPWANFILTGDGQLWAAADPRRGNEFFAAAQMQVDGACDFRIRYVAGVHERMRLLWRGVPYSIMAPPVDSFGLQEELILHCATGSRDGD